MTFKCIPWSISKSRIFEYLFMNEIQINIIYGIRNITEIYWNDVI